MEFIVKKTTELTETEQTELVSLFNSIFDRNRTIEQFRNQFLNAPLGYSFHSLIIDGGKIVGCDSFIPSYYIVNNKRILFANSVDVMVSKHYRDFASFYDMVIAAHDYMRENGVVCTFGFPNANSHELFIKAKLGRDVGRLTTYCLPYRIGGIKPKLRLLNCFSILFIHVYVFLTTLFASKEGYHLPIEKEAETYNATRYKRLDGKYNTVSHQDTSFVYKLMDYEGIKSAFLIDVFEKSAANFNKAVRYIIKNHHMEFDILLYVGRLPFRCHGLIRIPEKWVPKNFHFTGEILRKDEIDAGLFFNINNWDINLSNYDLL